MTTFNYGDDCPSPEYEALLQRREVAEYLAWWKRQQAQEDILDYDADKPTLEV
jgi:hypothetical protein